MTDQEQTSGAERVALAKEYFRRVDSGDPTLLDMFTEDTEIFFPKFGFAHGKAEILPFLAGLTSAVTTFDHPQDQMTFTASDNRVVVEGTENGRLASGLPFPGDARSSGLFCNVFEFRGQLISRMHVYADPDLAGQQPALFDW